MKKKITVCVLTYNHENTILRCLESVINQVTSKNWELEVLIGEDCSSDNTLNLIRSIARTTKVRFVIMANSANKGGTQNLLKILFAASGEYIALIEGDDYWTYKYKLIKQIGFLENNLCFSACFHNMIITNEHSNMPRKQLSFQKDIYELDDVIKAEGNFIPASSVVFRKSNLNNYCDTLFSSMAIADWPLNILNALSGKIKYFNHCWGTYLRESNTDSFTRASADMQLRENIILINGIDKFFNMRYHRHLSRYMNSCFLHYVKKSCFTSLTSKIFVIFKFSRMFLRNIYYNISINEIKKLILVFRYCMVPCK